MSIKDWSTTDANNATISGTSISWVEGQAPSTLNNSARAVMSDVRAWYEDAEWVNLGDTITYVSSTSFSVPGDLTSDYSVNRRVRAVGTLTGTIYGKITDSTYSSPNTTVTVEWDTGGLQNESLEVSLGILQYLQPEPSFAAGTKCVFYNAAAPAGWVIDSSTEWGNVRNLVIDNSGGGTYGGSDDPTLMDKIPSHTHQVVGNGTTSTTGNHTHTGGGYNAGSASGGCCANTTNTSNTGLAGNHNHTFSISVTSAANSGADNWEPYYAKFIVATKL